jgi:hypothetical protein
LFPCLPVCSLGYDPTFIYIVYQKKVFPDVANNKNEIFLYTLLFVIKKNLLVLLAVSIRWIQIAVVWDFKS